MTGASAAAKEHAIETKGAAGSTEVFVAKQKAAQTELKATSAAAKGAGIAMKALSIAGNMLIFTAITTGISLLTKAIDDYIHRTEIMLEKAEEAKSNIQDTNTQFESHKKIVDECASTYEKLSKGVDTLSNKNISLSDDDYEEYLRVTNELAEAFPQLRVTVDENGNSIIQFSDKTKTATENLKNFLEQEKQTANYKIAQSLPDLFGGVVAKKDELGKAKNALNELNQEMESFNRLSSGVTKGKNIFSGTGDYSNIYNTLVIALDKYRNSLIETGKVMDASLNPELLINAQQNTNGKYKIEFDTSGIEDIDKLSEYIADAFQDIDETVTDSLGDARTAFNNAQAEFDTAWVDFRANLINAMQSKASYQGLDTASKQLAEALVGNLPSEIAAQMDDDDPYKWISDNIISQLRNIEDPSIKEEFQSKIQELLSFEEGDLNIVSFAEELQRWLDANGIYIDLTPIIKDEQEAKTVLQKSINNIAGTNGATFGDKNIDDRKKLEEYTKNFTETERQHWLTVTNGIIGADNAIKAYEESLANASVNETDILSFSDAWEQLKNSTEDATKGLADDLIELAESGKLTAEALSEADTSEFFKNAGISAEEATRQINALVSSSTQLQSMSAQISKMSDMLADKKNGTVASASDLAGFDATVKGLDSWAEFERVMGSSKSSMEECQAAANALATEWVNNGNFLANLTEENKDYYTHQLKSMGIENAASVVTESLTGKKEALRLKYLALNAVLTDFEGKTNGACARLLEQENASDQTRVALADLVTQEILFNNSSLDVSGKISALNQLALAAYGVSDALTSGMGLDSRYYNGKTTEERAAEKMSILSSAKKVTSSQISISPTGSGNYKPSGGSGGSGSSSDTKQTIDWIERKISSLNDNIDLTQSKLDNLFNIKTPKGLSKQITDVSNKLKKASDNTDKWKSKLSKIKIPDSVKKLIQGGKDVNLSKYSKTEQKNIKKYQSTWKSYSSAKKKENSLYNQKWDLQTQKGKETLLKSQEKDYNTLAKIEEKAYKKYMSKAKSVKLSSSLKKKVQSGDYKISDYSSKTQSLIQEYQDWWDKAQDANKGKYEAKKNAKDKRIERYQLYVDDAEAKIAKSQALTELKSSNYKEQNKQLEKQKKYLKESYDWQIKIAKENGKILEADKLRSEYQKELNDLTKQEFDNIANTYDNKIGLTNNKIQAFQDQISLLEAQGQKVGSALYTKQMSLNNVNEKKLVAEREKLIAKLAEIPKGKDSWYEAQDKLFAVDQELTQIQIDNADLQKSINQLKFDRFDDLLDKLNDIVDETDFLKDMLSDNLFDESGMITDDGVTAMGLTAQNYDVYLAKAEKYKQMLSDVKDMYDAGKISLEEYEGYQRTYSQGQRDAIKSANDAKKAVIDYVKQGLDAQNDALSESIEKQKELLQSEKDLKDFQDRLADSNKSIADIQKQINALESDNSEENRKKLQQLKADLADAQKNQEDLLYDRSISDQEDALDQMLKNSQEQAENYLKDSEKVFVDALNYVNAHTYQVSQNLEKISKDTGYDISSNITNAWKDGGKAVDSYESILTGNVPNITSQISLITSAWQAAAEAAEKAAKAAKTATTNGYLEYTTLGKDADSDDNAIKLAEVKSFISANKHKATREKSHYASLNQYIYDKTGGYVLSKENEAKLADMLGVKISARELTGEQGKKDLAKILKELKNIGYSTGGLISIDDAIRYSGEDGIALVKNDEYILSPKQTDGFLTLAENAPQLAESLKNMALPQFSYPQIDRNISIANRTPTVVNNNFDNRVTVEGVATDKIVKDFENVATKQAEKVVSKINNITYAKGVRR